ncbi:nucleotide-binding protein [Granulicella paludicola]|uniref:nucleotide-binding protein n=1 Tax=Granulicella paludicola TaxID=474951 RepID=UPI0021DFD0E0|nr:protein mobD [Granulicella paludicola]
MTTDPISSLEGKPMNAPIVFVSGSKGGVGKSLTSMAVLDYLASKQQMVKLVDADPSNPDVFKSYSRALDAEQVDLDDVDGWIQLVNTCESPSFKTVVVNTPARNNDGVRKHGAILQGALQELGRPLITLWVINRQRDSLDLLAEYMDLMPKSAVHVVQNGYFGEQKKFELYHSSALHERVAGQDGKDLFLPDLADRVTDDLYSKRITLAQAAQQLKIGDRVELQRWRSNVAEMLSSIRI